MRLELRSTTIRKPYELQLKYMHGDADYYESESLWFDDKQSMMPFIRIYLNADRYDEFVKWLSEKESRWCILFDKTAVEDYGYDTIEECIGQMLEWPLDAYGEHKASLDTITILHHLGNETRTLEVVPDDE